MKVYELLKIGGELLKVMTQNDVLRDDWRFVRLYEEYKVMRENNMKHAAAIQMLSEDYCISTRTVERVMCSRWSMNLPWTSWRTKMVNSILGGTSRCRWGDGRAAAYRDVRGGQVFSILACRYGAPA